MQANLAYRSASAWDLGDDAYDEGDTLEVAMAKARAYGIRSGSNEYAAFMTAFGRRMRSKQVSLAKAAARRQAQETQTPGAGAPDDVASDLSHTVA